MARAAGHHAYLGALGGLIELPNARVDLAEQRASQVTETLAGRRQAYVAARARRSWKVQVPGSRPGEAGRLVELLRASPGPHIWVEPYAQVTNVLDPDVAALVTVPSGSVAGAGFVTSDGDYAPRAAAASPADGVVQIGPGPVVPGYPVTGAVYVSGARAGAQLALRFVSAGGAQVGADVVAPVPASGAPSRPYVAGVTPPGAALVYLRVTAVTRMARPSVTWTAGLLGWGPGHGCRSVLVTETAGSVRATHHVPHGVRTQVQSFTVVEVN